MRAGEWNFTPLYRPDIANLLEKDEDELGKALANLLQNRKVKAKLRIPEFHFTAVLSMCRTWHQKEAG